MEKLKSGMRGSKNDLIRLVGDLPNNLIMAEVGCYAGESTSIFLKSGKINMLYAIDPWSPECSHIVSNAKTKEEASLLQYVYDNMEWAEKSFDIRMGPFKNVVKLKMTLAEAIKQLPKLDFIYIDGNHDYEYVLEDIKLALKIVKKNGIISGHDYSDSYQGVKKAVNEMFNFKDVRLYKDSSWLVRNK